MIGRQHLIAAFAALFIALPGRGSMPGLPYVQQTPDAATLNHDGDPNTLSPRPAIANTEPAIHPLRHPISTFRDLNRGGGDVFRQPGALPYVAVGVLALASDKTTEKWFHVTPDATPSFSRFFNRFGDLTYAVPAVLVMYAAGSKQRDTSKLWTAALVNAGVWTQSVKMLTGKERPNRSPDAVRYHGPGNVHFDSFPSGHMTVATASAVVLGHEYPRAKLAFYALAACVGVARIKGADHWPSDVYWGAGVGYYGAWQALRHREDVLRWKF